MAVESRGEASHSDPLEWPPEGAKFFRKVCRKSIIEVECSNPFKGIRIFDLSGVDKQALTLKQVPSAYRPYPGCLFEVLSEEDKEMRFKYLCSLFRVLGTPTDDSRKCGLLYTVMHLWKAIHQHQRPSGDLNVPKAIALLEYFIDAGMVECFLRILSYSTDRKFILTEYNRYVPYRVLECLLTSTHVEQPLNRAVVHRIVEKKQWAVEIFLPILRGGLSALEQMVCCQLMGHLSCYAPGVKWLLDHWYVCSAVGRQLWNAYPTHYSTFCQYQDLQSVYQRSLYTPFPVDSGREMFDITQSPQLTTTMALTLVFNICAAHLDDTPVDRIAPCVQAVAEEGLHNHLGDVMCGILLNDDTPELSPQKFITCVSWSVLKPEGQKLAMRQMNRLPYTRRDNPLFFSGQSFSKRRSILAFLLTHALWLDESNGSLEAVMGLVSLLRGEADTAMTVVRLAGDLLFDLAHSVHQVRVPGLDRPLPIKSAIFEVFLELGGYSYYKENSSVKFTPQKCKFGGPVPQCIADTKEFCERFVREQALSNKEKQRLVRCADSFKTEGNDFFSKEQFEEAIVCYTRALDTCPLTCTGRRVTYYSNRAQCYLQTHQPQQAVSDCNRAIAQNSDTFNARWRRAQALQQMGANHFAALDYFSITHRDDKVASDALGVKRLAELKKEPAKLLDGDFSELAEKQLGPTVYRGSLKREYGKRVSSASTASSIPPHTGGQAYHQVFGMGEGVYSTRAFC